MKDMFYNYEYHIGQKEYAHGPAHMRPEKLDTNPNVEVVHDAFGNEIGVRAYHESKFKLYFFLDDCHSCSYDDDFTKALKGGRLLFEIINLHHESIYSIDIEPSEILDSTVCIELCSTAENTLKPGLYKLKLSVVNSTANIKNAIFYEDDSFLDIV